MDQPYLLYNKINKITACNFSLPQLSRGLVLLPLTPYSPIKPLSHVLTNLSSLLQLNINY